MQLRNDHAYLVTAGVGPFLTHLAALDWQDDAACRNLPPETADMLFFPPPRGGTFDPAAFALCNTCPVQATCAEYGKDDEYGIWGGLTPTQRLANRATQQT